MLVYIVTEFAVCANVYARVASRLRIKRVRGD